jgi:4-hydroxy-3-methylbut-2-enyl diphosphate reductase
VAKVHAEVENWYRSGRHVLLIGHLGHPEIVGTVGQIAGRVHLVATPADVAALEIGPGARVAYITQTTLSVDETRGVVRAILSRFPDAVGPDTKDICYATQNRQAAVRALAAMVDAIAVVGSANSSNSNRLCEIARGCGVRSRLFDDAGALDWDWLAGVGTLGITAGASAPEELVLGIVSALRARGDVDVTDLAGAEERVQFRLPAEVA